MPTITWTEIEVRTALPRERSRDGFEGAVGTPGAWQTFDSEGHPRYSNGGEAMEFVNALLVKQLTTHGVTYTAENGVNTGDIGDMLNAFVSKALRLKYNESFGWTDTEPRYMCSVFARKLLGFED